MKLVIAEKPDMAKAFAAAMSFTIGKVLGLIASAIGGPYGTVIGAVSGPATEILMSGYKTETANTWDIAALGGNDYKTSVIMHYYNAPYPDYVETASMSQYNVKWLFDELSNDDVWIEVTGKVWWGKIGYSSSIGHYLYNVGTTEVSSTIFVNPSPPPPPPPPPINPPDDIF